MDGVFCEVSEKVISEAEVFSRVRCESHGGMNFFFGSVRKENGGKAVVSVSYDAFAPLATRTFHDIAAEARVRWGDGMRICIVHRIGKLVQGEISVGVGVSSPHRDECYQASRYMIEEIKRRAPIWKREAYESGEAEWLKGHMLCHGRG